METINIEYIEEMMPLHKGEEGDLFISSTCLFSNEFEKLFKYWLVMCHNKDERDVFRLCKTHLAKAYLDVIGH